MSHLKTSFCTTCIVGVVDAVLSDNLEQILVEFGKDIGMIGNTVAPESFSQENCRRLLKEETIQTLGRNAPECKVDKTRIVIKLSNLATINIGDYVQILPNKYLMLSICQVNSQQVFQQIENKKLSPPLNPLNPDVKLSGPEK
jgi:hypothetical protein